MGGHFVAGFGEPGPEDPAAFLQVHIGTPLNRSFELEAELQPRSRRVLTFGDVERDEDGGHEADPEEEADEQEEAERAAGRARPVP